MEKFKMDNQLVELCAKALWDKSQTDPANQYKLSKIFKKTSPGPISWKEINDVDIIPNVAELYREKARIVIRVMRKFLDLDSKDAKDMFDKFVRLTINV
jgi:hypothetical protein